MQNWGTNRIWYKVEGESEKDFYLVSMRNLKDDNSITIMGVLIIVVMITMMITILR